MIAGVDFAAAAICTLAARLLLAADPSARAARRLGLVCAVAALVFLVAGARLVWPQLWGAL